MCIDLDIALNAVIVDFYRAQTGTRYMWRLGVGTVDTALSNLRSLRLNAHVDFQLRMTSDLETPWWIVAKALVSRIRLHRVDALILDPSAEMYPSTQDAWTGIHDLIRQFKQVYTAESVRRILLDSM